MPAWLQWLLLGAALLVLPVVLRFWADDYPRTDDDPDVPARQSGGDTLPLAA